MAEWERRESTETYIDYVLPNPTNHAEMKKALAAIDSELSGVARWDDDVTVTADDCHIILRRSAGDRESEVSE